VSDEPVVAQDEFLRQIDWQRPWLAPLLPLARPICNSPDWRSALNAAADALALRNHAGHPIRFVPQSALPGGVAYEAFIGDTGNVPTRDNLHDLFNALVWLTFPKIKVQLNALQASEIARTTGNTVARENDGSMRGKLRDAATIFDENAALFVTSNTKLSTALRQHDWHDLFLGRRASFAHECNVYLFGHALMEKLVKPYKAITAHAWVVHVSADFFVLAPQERLQWIDCAVAAQLAAGLTTANFTPLPVLGVPGWWAMQDALFYEDNGVFRPARRQEQ
jgi:hypothetical protein